MTQQTIQLPLENLQNPLEDVKVGDLFGRVTCTSEKDWEHATHMLIGPSSQPVFFFGPDGLEDLLKNPSRFDFMVNLGFEKETIQYYLENKSICKIFVFKPTGDKKNTLNLNLATWDNTLEEVRKFYPNVYDKVKDKLNELKKTSYKKIQKTVKSQKKQEDYKNMNYHELQAIDHPELWQIRAFLERELNAFDLFRGDGYTDGPNHTPTYMEYFGHNYSIEQFGNNISTTQIDYRPEIRR